MRCGKLFLSHECCPEGHYICNACHAARGMEAIRACCLGDASTDPIALAQRMMDDPAIHMHGNEHHVLVGAALLCAYHNAGGQLELEAALMEMEQRGGAYPGGACGLWGCCGAAVSAGMFWSIVNGTTPLSEGSWGEGNQLTARALNAIGALGGPRCCKRNAFTAIREAVGFVNERGGVQMTLPERIVCRYFPQNRQCKREACPYYPRREQAQRNLKEEQA